MILTKELWTQAVKLEEECRRRGDTAITRTVLQEALRVPEYHARFLCNALANKDVLKFLPAKFDTEGGKTELVMADLHIPYHDPLAVEAILAYAEPLRPDIITLLGDTIDFYQISTFTKNPKQRGVASEIQATRDFLDELRFRFPGAQIIYKRGNHEERLDRYIMQNAGNIYELVDDLLTSKLGFADFRVDYHEHPFRIGKLWHMHGHEHMSKMTNAEHICNVVWKYVHDHFICGHYHRNQEKTYKRGLSGETFWGGVIGYGAGYMEYAHLNTWNQGFGVIRYDSSGKFRAELRQVINGEVL